MDGTVFFISLWISDQVLLFRTSRNAGRPLIFSFVVVGVITYKIT